MRIDVIIKCSAAVLKWRWSVDLLMPRICFIGPLMDTKKSIMQVKLRIIAKVSLGSIKMKKKKKEKQWTTSKEEQVASRRWRCGSHRPYKLILLSCPPQGASQWQLYVLELETCQRKTSAADVVHWRWTCHKKLIHKWHIDQSGLIDLPIMLCPTHTLATLSCVSSTALLPRKTFRKTTLKAISLHPVAP